MMPLNKPLKEILSKYFFQYWRTNNHKFPTSLRETILKNVNSFLDCGDPKIGYTSFICLKCRTIHKTPFSCKSRFCSSCGKVYAETWANNLSDNLIQCPHRHAVFSLPTGWIREFFFLHRHLLKNLADASYLALKYSFKKLGISNIGVIAKYIGRYLARPAIAEYRIIFFNEKIVKFWYQSPDSKKKITITLTLEKFLGRILSHIPPKNFKMVRRFGLYSRRSKNKISRKTKLFKTKPSWAERFFKAFGINPLICRKCSSHLHLLEIFHVKYGIIQYNDYSP